MRVAAASALVRDGDGRVLLALRGTGANRGRWSLPGGKAEAGERPAQTAVREVEEETGLRIAAGAELEVVLVEDEGTTYEIHVVAGTVLGGELAARDDAVAVRWYAPEELASLPVTAGLVELLRRHAPPAPGGPA